jgi:hypothetical protein
MGAGQIQQQQQQQDNNQQQQQQRGPGWAGTVAANDYCQNFVDTALRPQNYLGGGALAPSMLPCCMSICICERL